MTDNRPKAPRSDAGEANAEQGQVLLDGPDGVAVAMTPGAAEATGQHLINAAGDARGQAGDAHANDV